MSKVLIFANSASGLYDFREDLIKKFVSLGNEIYTAIPATEYLDELNAIGCKIIDTPVDRRGMNLVKDFSLIVKYNKIIKKVSPDIVITYTIKPNIYAGFLCGLKKVPYVINITGLGTTFQNEGILKQFITFMYKCSSKKAKVVFFENIENLETFVDGGIVESRQTQLLNGAGVNLEKFSFTEYPKDSGITKFLFMGRVMIEKGVDELFESMDKLYNDGYKFELDVLGYYEENYETIIKKYEKNGWLSYHGYQSDVRPFIKNCNCFVLPSWHEGMANTNLECGAMGRPIITSDIHGCKEAVIENESGFLCQPKNSESLYNQLKKFIELSYDQKVEMGKCARKHMEDVFDKKKVVEQTIKRLFE